MIYCLLLLIDMLSKLQHVKYLECGCEDREHHGVPPCIVQFMKTECEKLQIDVPNEDLTEIIYDNM